MADIFEVLGSYLNYREELYLVKEDDSLTAEERTIEKKRIRKQYARIYALRRGAGIPVSGEVTVKGIVFERRTKGKVCLQTDHGCFDIMLTHRGFKGIFKFLRLGALKKSLYSYYPGDTIRFSGSLVDIIETGFTTPYKYYCDVQNCRFPLKK